MHGHKITSSGVGVPRLLLGLAWPLAISGKLDYLAAAVIHMWMGKLVGPSGLALLGVLTPWAYIAIWVFLIVPRGVASMVARDFGAGRQNALNLVASGSVLQLLISVVVVLAGLLGLWLGADALSAGIEPTPAEIFQYGAWYLLTLPLYGMAMLLLFAIFATGNTRAGLIRSILGLVMVSVATPLCIDQLGFGIVGPAVADALFHLVLAVTMVGLLATWKRNSSMGELTGGLKQYRHWSTILSIGGPLQVARIAQHCTLALYAHIAARDGTAAMGGYEVAIMVMLFAGVLSLTWGQAALIAFGQNLGARNQARALEIVKVALIGAVLLGASMFLLASFAEPLVRLFTSDPAVIEHAVETLGILRWGIAAIGLWQLCLALFEAVGRTMRAAVLFFLADVLAVAVATLLGSGLEAATWALVTSNVVKTLLLVTQLGALVLRPTRALG